MNGKERSSLSASGKVRSRLLDQRESKGHFVDEVISLFTEGVLVEA